MDRDSSVPEFCCYFILIKTWDSKEVKLKFICAEVPWRATILYIAGHSLILDDAYIIKIIMSYLTAMVLLWDFCFLAWKRLWSHSEQYCSKIQEKGQTCKHGEEQRAGPAFLLPHLAQDYQVHWLWQWWVFYRLSLWETTRQSWFFSGKHLMSSLCDTILT